MRIRADLALILASLAMFGCRKSTASSDAPPTKPSSGTKASNDTKTDDTAAKTYTLDDVCNRFVTLYDVSIVGGDGSKVAPEVHKKELDDCLVDAKKTQAEDAGKFQCVGACAMVASDTSAAQRCRKNCETDPEKFCMQLLDDVDDEISDDDEAKTAARCAQSLKDAKTDAEKACRRNCVIAAKTAQELYKCADAACPAN